MDFSEPCLYNAPSLHTIDIVFFLRDFEVSKSLERFLESERVSLNSLIQNRSECLIVRSRFVSNICLTWPHRPGTSIVAVVTELSDAAAPAATGNAWRDIVVPAAGSQ